MKLKPIKVTINGKPVIFWETPVTMNELIDHAGISMDEQWRQTRGLETFPVANGHVFDLKKNP